MTSVIDTLFNPRRSLLSNHRRSCCLLLLWRRDVSLPRPVASALYAFERSGPLARLLLAVRFSYLCAAFRGGKNT